MIPEIYLQQWQKNAPWQTLDMIEQDLIISRALVELYKQPNIPKNLAFRGGTALNKLFITPAARYSEDIDFVQINAEPIGETISQIREALDYWLGVPKRKMTERSVKLIYRYVAINGIKAKLKIEINICEHFYVEPLKTMDFFVESKWFQGSAILTTYQLDELMATKLRALYQRRKGRDLFDIWYVLEKQLVDAKKILAIFEKYCEANQENITRALFEKNMDLKRKHLDFREEVDVLLNTDIVWKFDDAEKLVHQKIISQLKGEPWQGEPN